MVGPAPPEQGSSDCKWAPGLVAGLAADAPRSAASVELPRPMPRKAASWIGLAPCSERAIARGRSLRLTQGCAISPEFDARKKIRPLPNYFAIGMQTAL